MNGLTNRKNIVAVFTLLALLFLANSVVFGQRFSAWSAAQNLGSNINTTSSEVCPFIAPDNLSFYFASDRAGGAGGFDLYVSTRPNTSAPWGAPVNLGLVNTSSGELCPTVVPGGLEMYFISNKPNGCGGNDIYVSQRPTTTAEWGAAVNVGCQVNSPQGEMSPSLFTGAGGATSLYFSSNRPGGPGLTDIYVSQLQAGGQFGAPAPVAELNTPLDDQRPNIRVRDGLEMFFESSRTGTVGAADLYVATRAGASAAWGTPQNLGLVNSASDDSRPSLSFDGRELYFHSTRPGGAGAADIYVARRRVIFTPNDTDGDGRSDIRAYRQSANAFYILNSTGSSLSIFNFGGTGQNTFIPGVNDDYDGDGKSDLVTGIVPSGGVRTWRVLQSGSNTVREVQWGLSSDQTVPADYDGDGRVDIAVYRRSEGIWYILQSTTNQMRAEYWGQAPNDFAMVGDFDADGISDLTVARSSASGGAATWFTRRSSDGALAVDYWGGGVTGASDNLFPAISPDIDGDGITDRMIVRDPDSTAAGNELTYFIQRSSDRSMFAATWGLDTDGRAFGDYDGDGKTDLAARRVIGGQLIWFILLSSNNYNTVQPRVIHWGMTGDA